MKKKKIDMRERGPDRTPLHYTSENVNCRRDPITEGLLQLDP
jgi:hypothetical protein